MSRIDRKRIRHTYPFARTRPLYAFINETDADNSDDMATLENLGIISVKQSPYSAAGDGVTNDSTAIGDALNAIQPGQALFFPSGTYLMGTVTINNKRDIEIFGYNATILLTGTNAGLYMAGTCDNVEIHNLKIRGNGQEVDGHVGLSMSSGQGISNTIVEKLFITGTTIGIGFNADLSGYIRDCVIVNNRIEGIVGTDPGEGTGIYFADGSNAESRHQIINNRIARTQRHAIHCAKGRGVLIQGNMINSHRNTLDDGAVRAAIFIGRSQNVICENNIVTDSFNSSIMVGSDEAAFPTRNVTIANNHIVNPTFLNNPVPHIVVGEDTQTGGRLENIRISENYVYSTGSSASALRLNAGHGVTVKNNEFILSGALSTTRGIELMARGEGALTSLSSSNWLIEKNSIKITDTSNLPTSNPIRLNTLWLSSSVRTTFRHNEYNSVSSSFSLAESPINNRSVVIENDGIGILFNTGSATAAYPIRNSNSTSENVAGLKGMILDNPSSTTLSSLTNGYENQEITLWANNSTTTLAHGVTTNALHFADGTNKLLMSGSSATFIRLNNVWRNTAFITGGIYSQQAAAAAATSNVFTASLYVTGTAFVQTASIGVHNPNDANIAGRDLTIGGLTRSISGISILSTTGGTGSFIFTDTALGNIGGFGYSHVNDRMTFRAANADRFYLGSAGIIPSTTITYDIGESSTRWRDVYARTGSYTGNITGKQLAYFPFSFTSIVDTTVWINFSTTTEQASADADGARFICPHDGRVVAVRMRSSTNLGNTIVSFSRNGSTNATTDLELVPSGSVISFDDAHWPFSAGDWIGIAINPTNVFGDVDGIVIMEFDQNT